MTPDEDEAMLSRWFCHGQAHRTNARLPIGRPSMSTGAGTWASICGHRWADATAASRARPGCQAIRNRILSCGRARHQHP